MYPDEIAAGLDLYQILIAVGVVACMAFIRILGDRLGFRAAYQNLLLLDAAAAVILGYGAAVLTQAVYNMADRGGFEITRHKGATFYGGLIGGAAVFLAVYFAVGRFLFRDGYHLKRFRAMTDMAAACVTVAHGFGRIGCLMAGCCYGKPTEAWYGVRMVALGYRVIPVQLFEAIFLFALSAATFLLSWRGKRYGMPIYLVAYGVWRFCIEFLRGDERGRLLTDLLSPSQIVSVFLAVGGAVLLVSEILYDRKGRAANPPDAPEPQEAGAP